VKGKEYLAKSFLFSCPIACVTRNTTALARHCLTSEVIFFLTLKKKGLGTANILKKKQKI
jgi:hypothetical protein